MQVKKIPFGLRLNFNLCQDINNEELSNRISNILDQVSSRFIETLHQNCNLNLEHFNTEFETLKVETIEQFGDRAGKTLILDAKKHIFDVTKQQKAEEENRCPALSPKIRAVIIFWKKNLCYL